MTETMLMQAKGVNGTLELWPDHIHIKREGLTSLFYNRNNRGELPLTAIYSIDFREVPAGLIGYISFNGGTDGDCMEDFCVSFLKHQEHAFKEIYHRIEQQREMMRTQIVSTQNQHLSIREEHHHGLF